MIKNLQVWIVFSLLVGLAVVAMFFITRSNMVIERSRSAAQNRALRSRVEVQREQQLARAIRQMDRELVRLLTLESMRPVEGFGNRDVPPMPPEPGMADPYAVLYFSQSENGELSTHWSSDGRQVQQWLPSLETLDPSLWRKLWLGTSRYVWMPQPKTLYGFNEQLQEQFGDANSKALVGASVSENPGVPDMDMLDPEQPTGTMYPFWFDGQLCFARWVSLPDGQELQGCVLDWNRLRENLLRDVRDRFEVPPSLVPVQTAFPKEGSSSYSVWIPARIELPPLEMADRPQPSDGGWVLLALGWLFLLGTCGAVGMLLFTVLKMSNRREAFVSSVTHELRTPLTAFRLYADLLAKAPDPAKTREYAKTLQQEAERLSHLVENVLCYSRMEKRGITSHHRMTTIGELLDAMVPRLEEHCFRAGMILDFADASPDIRRTEILTDPSAVDRILVNLVDNACKYGKTDESQVIELKAHSADRWMIFEVADHGPGLAKAQRRRLFKAYNHGQIGADSPNTTIGLGLNICFNLARALGGSLGFQDNQPGCRFILKIPMDLHRR